MNELINDLEDRIAIHLIDYLEASKLEDRTKRVYNKASAYSSIIEIRYIVLSMYQNKLIDNKKYREIEDYISQVLDKIYDTLECKDLNEYNIKTEMIK
jgi:hypothetical protein